MNSNPNNIEKYGVFQGQPKESVKEEKKDRTFAVFSLLCGIISLMFNPAGIAGLLFACVEKKKIGTVSVPSIFGIVFSLIGILFFSITLCSALVYWLKVDDLNILVPHSELSLGGVVNGI